MFCPKCGSENPESAATCMQCGATLGAAPSQKATNSSSDSPNIVGSAQSPKPSEGKNRFGGAKIWIVVAVVVVVVAVGAIAGFNAYQAHQEEVARQEALAAQMAEEEARQAKSSAGEAVDEAAVAGDLSGQETVMKGTASDDYVETAPYAVVSFTLASKEPNEQDDSLMVNGELVIENGFFSETKNVSTRYLYSDGSYVLDTVEAESAGVEPLRGISKDEEHGIANAEGNFSGTLCTIQSEAQVQDYWFGKTEKSTEYSYEFDGSKWVFSGEESQEHITDVSGIYGTYVDPRGSAADDHGYFNSFVISEPATGAIDDADMELVWTPAKYDTNGKRMTVSGSVHYKGALYLSVEDGNVAFQGDVGGYPLDDEDRMINMRSMEGLITPTQVIFDDSAEWIVEGRNSNYQLFMGGIVLDRS